MEAKRQADIAAENARIEAENKARAQQLEGARLATNARIDNIWDQRPWLKSDDSWTTKPGTGYHFGANWKGDDGNYYTTFQSNRGSNVKFYSISERKWISEYGIYTRRCANCNEVMRGELNRFDFKCLHCGTVLPKGS